MKALLTAALAAIVLALPVSASAHYGDLWFTTAKNATGMIEYKYRLDVFEKCIPASFAHHRSSSFGAMSYDHFVCIVTPPGRHACWVTAHITGGDYSSVVLTSSVGTKGIPGCSPADVRRR